MATVAESPASIDVTPLLTALDVNVEDWKVTPWSLQHGVLRLWAAFQHLQQEVQQMHDELQHLREQLGQHSQNSSKPPSTDPPQAPTLPPQERTGRAAGGQRGHGNTNRPLMPVEQLAAPPIPCRPETCQHCGHPLTVEDCRPEPERHQIIDLPPIVAQVFEYQRYTACCPHCGQHTQADLPPGVPRGGYGPMVTAICCLLTGVYHLSKRAVSTLMGDCFQVPMSEASIQKQEQTMSPAMEEPWREALKAVQTAPQVHLDETGWDQSREADPPSSLSGTHAARARRAGGLLRSTDIPRLRPQCHRIRRDDHGRPRDAGQAQESVVMGGSLQSGRVLPHSSQSCKPGGQRDLRRLRRYSQFRSPCCV